MAPDYAGPPATPMPITAHTAKPRPVVLGGPLVLMLAAAAAWTFLSSGPSTSGQQFPPQELVLVAFVAGQPGRLHGPVDHMKPSATALRYRTQYPSKLGPGVPDRIDEEPPYKKPPNNRRFKAGFRAGMKKWEGIRKRHYLDRLRHRRWAATSPWPRVFGFVEKWDDMVGEGLLMDQEKTQMYLIIRDDISKVYFNHKTLQTGTMVEFSATDEIDTETKLPLAKNLTGICGTYATTSMKYAYRMLSSGNFPLRWQDDEKEYTNKHGEWWRYPKFRR